MAERRALVVDDSPTMRQMIAFALSRVVDLEVVLAEDGFEAFKHLVRAKFDIILTDLDMPVMDGAKFLRLLRGDPEHKGVPVVVVSGAADDHERRRLLQAGAAEYLPKPVQSPQIVSAVKRLLGDED